MGDVESYVHTHFRNDTRKSAAKPMIAEQRSRVPLVPKDIDLGMLSKFVIYYAQTCCRAKALVLC